MDVREVMSTFVHTIQKDDSIPSAAKKMREGDIGCLVVLESDTVAGVITDRDLAIRCLSDEHGEKRCTIAEHMTSPVITVEPGVDMLEAARIMAERKVGRLPVVENGKLIGLLSLSDIALAVDLAMVTMYETLHDLLRGMGAARSK